VTQTLEDTYEHQVYEHDPSTDMFQIGRVRRRETPVLLHRVYHQNDLVFNNQTVSRFSCRIVCSREPPYACRIYAAGFNSNCHIFLGSDAVRFPFDGAAGGAGSADDPATPTPKVCIDHERRMSSDPTLTLTLVRSLSGMHS